MTIGSTFSGIGAELVAASMLGWNVKFKCEINPFGRQVLDYYYPNAESYEDITKTDFSKWRGRIDVLTGGFPCQPFSYAGKRRGSEDDRYLWPYMLRCIQQVRPTWFIGENVAGIATMVLPGEDVKVGSGGTIFDETDYMERDERYVIEEICHQLEDIGYSVQPMLVPACAVGAPHRRDRIFFIAHRDTTDTERIGRETTERVQDGRQSEQQESCNEGTVRTTPNPSCSGSGAQEAGGRTESDRSDRLSQQGERRQPTQRTDGLSEVQEYVADTDGGQREERMQHGARNKNQKEDAAGVDDRTARHGGQWYAAEYLKPTERWRAFPTVSPVHRGNDGLPFDVDDLTIPFSRWKKESLKAYGNAIVVQVMYEIFRAIDEVSKN